jgi:hypothetical protein
MEGRKMVVSTQRKLVEGVYAGTFHRLQGTAVSSLQRAMSDVAVFYFGDHRLKYNGFSVI